MTTTSTTKKACSRCGAAITWKKSTKTGRMYPSEACMRQGYTGRWFPSSRLHKCAPPKPLSTSPFAGLTVYGQPAGPIEDPATHTHRWLPWRKPGGITGSWCQGCRQLMID